MKTVEPAGKTTYFPFPGYSEEMVGTTVTTRRVTYTIAGTAVASRVQTFSPTAGNTLYRLYTDHLGSTVTHSTMSGGLVPNSNIAYYYPYGSYRGTPPTQTLTDRDFTGQRENRELGLLYYQARFYVPSIGRFASADTIVPDPANPQSLNRYTYVENNPLRYSDPSGHIACAVLGTEVCDPKTGEYVDSEVTYMEDENHSPFIGSIPPWWNKEQIQQAGEGTLSGQDKGDQLRYAGLLHMYVQLWFKETIRPTAELEVRIPKAGRADIVDGAEIWEVKPNGVYGYRDDAQAQLMRYVAHRPGSRVGSFVPKLMGQGVTLQHPIVPNARELVVKMDPKLPGIIIYQERNRTRTRVYQPSFAYDVEWAKALLWATGAGLGAYGLGSGGGGQPGLVY